MYKVDWIRTGGFDVEKFTTRWGGEDWALLDRYITWRQYPLTFPEGLQHMHFKAA